MQAARMRRVAMAGVVAALGLVATGGHTQGVGLSYTWATEPALPGVPDLIGAPPAALPSWGTSTSCGNNCFQSTDISQSLAADPVRQELVDFVQVYSAGFTHYGGGSSLTDETWVGTAAEMVKVQSAVVYSQEGGVINMTTGFDDSGAVLAWDPALRAVVRLIACPAGTCVFMWSGVGWKKVAVSGAAPTIAKPSVTYDAAHSRLVVISDVYPNFATYFLSGPASALRWTQGPARPAPVDGQSAAYLPAQHTVYAFDGTSTWALGAGGWVEQTPSVSPPARVTGTYALSYDGVTGRIVLFGGTTPGGTILRDTWLFDGHSWTRVPTLMTPPQAGRMTELTAAGGLLMLALPPANAGFGPPCINNAGCTGSTSYVLTPF